MKKVALFSLISVAVLLQGCESSGDPNDPRELVQISGLRSFGNGSSLGDMRLTALQETAETTGAQAGLAWRAEQINCFLKERETELEQIYNFRALLLRDDILPPVLEEGRREMHIASYETVRAADVIYRVISPPIFVSNPPHWREYLWMDFTEPERPNETLLPKNANEAAVWNCYIRKGWNHGIEQADIIFEANLNRLTRDYNGMVLYHRLYAQNMITAPYVSRADLGVTGDAREMRVNDRILRIAATSQLNTNATEWKAGVYPIRVKKELPNMAIPSPHLKPPKHMNAKSYYNLDNYTVSKKG